MRRRDFLTVAATTLWPLYVMAQKLERVRRIGVLMVYKAEDPAGEARAAAFTNGLAELGWIAGRNVQIEYRWPGSDLAQIGATAQELVSLAPDAIMCTGTPAALALKQVTQSIPIVFVSVDPIGRGIVESSARPGGNMTGFALYEFSVGGKWLELLKEIAPNVTRVGLIYNPHTAPYSEGFAKSIDVAAPAREAS